MWSSGPSLWLRAPLPALPHTLDPSHHRQPLWPSQTRAGQKPGWWLWRGGGSYLHGRYHRGVARKGVSGATWEVWAVPALVMPYDFPAKGPCDRQG